MVRILALLSILTLFNPSARCQEHPFETTATGVVTLQGAGFARADIALGELPIGSRGRVALIIHNELNRDFAFDGLFSACSCVKASVAKGSLGANESLEVDLELNTPSAARRVSQDVMLKLGSKDMPEGGLQIILRYSLKELVAFKEPMVIAYAPGGSSAFTFQIPLEVSPSLDTKLVSFESSGSLKSIKAQIVKVADGHAADCSIPRAAIGADETVGEIRMLRSGLLVDTLTCLIRSRPPVSVAPTTVRFVKSEDKPGVYNATTIVKLNPDSYPNRFATIVASSIGCASDAGKVSIECKQIAPGLYRAFIVLKNDDPSVLPTELYWSVSAADESARTKSKVFVSQ